MLRKAFFRAFFFLLLMMALASPAFAFVGGGGNLKGVPADDSHPLSNNMQWFVRRVPVLFYDPSPNGAEYNTEANTFSLKNPDLVWGELWTKPEWANESSRFGLNELYIPINPAMTPAPASGTGQVAVPMDNVTVQTANWIDQKNTVTIGDVKWGADMSPAVFLNMPLPSRDAFLDQAAGMNAAQAAKYQGIFGRQIPSSDGSVSYFRALDAFDHGSTYYYHLFLEAGPQGNNFAVAADVPPYYDERTPTGIGFYRGKDWAENLKSDPGSVPGFIGAITPWCNLKLTGPNEVTGNPGEEKEVEFTATSEVASDVTTDVGIKRDGQGQFDLPVKGLTLPAWAKVPVKLKFKIEDKPYTVRVKVDPNESILETRYDDNYVDVTVKPYAPDMYVKTLDPGASEVNPGQAYTGTVTYGLASDYPVPVKATLSLTNNGWAAIASDGTPLNDQVPVEFQPGEEKTYTFTWHGSEGGNNLVAKIHPVNPPDDRNWSNNKKEAWVPMALQCTDVSVNLTSPITTLTAGQNLPLRAHVSRDSEGPAGPVRVQLNLSGGGVSDAKIVKLERSGNSTVAWNLRINSAGSYTFHVTARLLDGVEDCRLGNNSDSFSAGVRESLIPRAGDGIKVSITGTGIDY